MSTATTDTTGMRRGDGDLAWPLRRAIALYPERPAVQWAGTTVVYRELSHHVDALRGGLRELGIPAGGRIGWLGVNSLAHLAGWLAIPTGGWVFVDLNFRLSPAELAFIVEDCEVELLICDAEQLPVARELARRCPSLRQLVLDTMPAADDDGARDTTSPATDDGALEAMPYAALLEATPQGPTPATPDQLAAISYTGGTTGQPKGVMLSHGNLLANAWHNLVATGHGPEDRWLHVCPMFHVAGTSNVFACTWAGAFQHVLPRFEADQVAAVLDAGAITHTTLVPTMLGMLLQRLAATRQPAPASLRHIQYAASPISPALQRQVLEVFDCDIAQFYGMTEAAPTVTHLSPADHRRGITEGGAAAERLHSIGTPVVGVETEVRRPDGTPCDPEEVGELWLRGANVMLGYWNRPEATAAALVDGWYRSGDAARIDRGGYLYLVDRLKDMIITGAENVYSIEVEAALCEHPAVLEAAVFGIPDPRWGEAVHAVVVISVDGNSPPSGDGLIAHCRPLIAGYKIPRSIELRTEPLPKSGPGKVLKHQLREPYWTDHQRRIG